MARSAPTSERTFQHCIRLLEQLGLVAVERCCFEGTNVQSSNQFSLLTSPEESPVADPDPSTWPAPVRSIIYVTKGANRRRVSDGHPLRWLEALPRQADTPPPSRLTPLEGNTRKEESCGWNTNGPNFTIEEIGLTNRHVPAATLGELARRGDTGRSELET